jgi:hypothetical protein
MHPNLGTLFHRVIEQSGYIVPFFSVKCKFFSTTASISPFTWKVTPEPEKENNGLKRNFLNLRE